jgi:hypothetical protein
MPKSTVDGSNRPRKNGGKGQPRKSRYASSRAKRFAAMMWGGKFNTKETGK